MGGALAPAGTHMERKITVPRMHDALSAFLDSHVGTAYRDDVGPLFGQVSEIRDHRFANATSPRFHEAVNVAVSSEAMRGRPPRRRAARILSRSR